MAFSRRLAVLLALIALTTGVLLPFAGRPLGPHDAFLPAFFGVALICHAFSAWLLAQQFLATGRVRTLGLAGAYGWCLVTILPHVLVFPGVLAEAGLIASTASSALWLWTAWHVGFAVLLAVTATLPSRVGDQVVPERGRRRWAWSCASALVVAGAGVTLAVTGSTALLPEIIVGGDYSPLSVTVGPWVVAVHALAVVLVWRHARAAPALERWLLVAVTASLGDVLLTLLAQQRFTLGWYSGRMLALAAASVVLLAFVGEVTRMHRDLEMASDRLRRLADIDDLTGLHNRRAATTRAQQVVARCAERGEPCALALLDVDHFKDVNDRLGHTAGDQVLFAVAGRLARGVREGDLVGRYGGEEFLLVLPGLDSLAAHQVLERVVAQVRDTPIRTGAGPQRVTISAGLAVVVGDRLHDAVNEADAALYAAKAAGRDRVRTAPFVPAQLRRTHEVVPTAS